MKLDQIFSVQIFTLALILLGSSPTIQADHTADPTAATAAGSFQDELGCPGDWQPDCAATHLDFDAEDEVWQKVFNVPAGNWEYKLPLNDSWDENYGQDATPNGPNIALSLGTVADVKFYYDHETHWVTDNVNSVIATAVGSFQDELGCPGDWQPDCLRSWLQDPDGDGIYTFTTDQIPAGSYEAKVAHDESWDISYGAGGTQNGDNIPFSVPENATLLFAYDSVSHILLIGSSGPAGYAIIHYYRGDGDYGDHTTGDYTDYWGLHLWGDGLDLAESTDWTNPKPFLGEDEYGRFAWVKLNPAGGMVNFIVHRGDTKDTDLDRNFDSNDSPETWLAQDDGSQYNSQASAQGFATVRYHRPDGVYGDPASSDYNHFWGLHLWGDAIVPSESTDWTDPKKPDGKDDYGIFWHVLLQDPSQPVNFIIHRGDNKDPGPDQGFTPDDMATVWVQSGDFEIYAQRGAAEGYATLHYHRPNGDYGDPTSPDYNDFWGLHVWTGAESPSDWTEPVRPAYFDLFGAVYEIPLTPDATELAYILHRGDSEDPGADQYLNLINSGYEVWQLQYADPDNPYILPVAGRFTEDPILLLFDGIAALMDAGVLNKGQGNALTVKLFNALDRIARDQKHAAANQVSAFINQVEEYVAESILTADQGAVLIAAAEDVLNTLVP
jgi:hypothetical protein